MLLPLLVSIALLAAPSAQQQGTYEPEVHQKLQWSRCGPDKTCSPVNGQITMDADYRWLHERNTYKDCHYDGHWDELVCNGTAACTDKCVLEGASYKYVYGVNTTKDALRQQFRTSADFANNYGSRVYLMENQTRYQTFTLLNNELAFDVDLSTIGCGLNSALYFVEMDADGGVARFPAGTNTAGAEYGMGYCDATCPQDLRYVGGKANTEGFTGRGTLGDREPSPPGYYGACCSQFDVWNSNSHSYRMSTHTCGHKGYRVCEGDDCLYWKLDRVLGCDPSGCDYNPFRMGARDFYGKNKTVDTARKITVVTQFGETKVTQFFIQDGKRIESPAPTLSWPGLPASGGLSHDMCVAKANLFSERDIYSANGGWETHLAYLRRPMVLAMSILDDKWSNNLWLDSHYPPEREASEPGTLRGDCPRDESDPYTVRANAGRSAVTWSNLRFGPIGSTV